MPCVHPVKSKPIPRGTLSWSSSGMLDIDSRKAETWMLVQLMDTSKHHDQGEKLV